MGNSINQSNLANKLNRTHFAVDMFRLFRIKIGSCSIGNMILFRLKKKKTIVVSMPHPANIIISKGKIKIKNRFALTWHWYGKI